MLCLENSYILKNRSLNSSSHFTFFMIMSVFTFDFMNSFGKVIDKI